VQLLMNGRLVKTTRFDSYRDVGDPVASSKVYNSQYADELVFLNINRTERAVSTLLDLIEKVSAVCFMPLTFGGGLKSLAEAEQLIKNGADKVVVNSSSFENPGLITEIAGKFGSQAAVASIDARWSEAQHRHVLASDCGRKPEAVDLQAHVADLQARGAGEIFINSIDRDGTMEGYDLRLIQLVMAASKVPVIACGGAGTYAHMKEAFVETDVSALACGSLFNFGDSNPIRAKAFLTNYNLPFKRV